MNTIVEVADREDVLIEKLLQWSFLKESKLIYLISFLFSGLFITLFLSKALPFPLIDNGLKQLLFLSLIGYYGLRSFCLYLFYKENFSILSEELRTLLPEMEGGIFEELDNVDS